MEKDDVLRAFFDLQDVYTTLIQRSKGLPLDRIRVRSAFTPLLRFSAAVWLQAMPRHQLRHLQQMKRIRENPGFREK
ncbi:MAG: hypothetical protein LAT67_14010 [Balneolales bacterium]|nr:hypothetical protein [Balneolales bacterium]